jgi:hypothetical protein
MDKKAEKKAQLETEKQAKRQREEAASVRSYS